MPYPPADGGAQVTHFSTIGLLGQKVEVKVLAINPTRQYINPETIPDHYIHEVNFESVIIDTRIKLLPLFINLFKKESYFTERFSSKDFENKLYQILSDEKYDVVQLEHVYLCKFLPIIRKVTKAKIIVRPQNVEYVIWERYINGIKNPLKKLYLMTTNRRLKMFEQENARLVDGILALTKDDALLFQRLAPEAKISVVPMGYDYNRISEYNYLDQYAHPITIYHLGSMDWLPNEEAVKWFIEKVIPLLKQRGFSQKIVIAGHKMPDWVYNQKFSFVEIQGSVTEPLEFQKDKQIMIVPLLSGSGIRAKIIEGLALGKAIISTTIGAQGIEYTDGKNIVIADTPEEFADKLISLSNNMKTCMNLSKAARELSELKYNHVSIAKSMIKFYNEISGN